MTASNSHWPGTDEYGQGTSCVPDHGMVIITLPNRNKTPGSSMTHWVMTSLEQLDHSADQPGMFRYKTDQ